MTGGMDLTPPVTLFAIGGPRHRQRIQVAADQSTYLDLVSASTYYRKPMSYVRRNITTTAPDGLFVVDVLVHESLIAQPADQPAHTAAKHQAASGMWTDVVLCAWMEEHGEQKPLTDLPAHMRAPAALRPTTPPPSNAALN